MCQPCWSLVNLMRSCSLLNLPCQNSISDGMRITSQCGGLGSTSWPSKRPQSRPPFFSNLRSSIGLLLRWGPRTNLGVAACFESTEVDFSHRQNSSLPLIPVWRPNSNHENTRQALGCFLSALPCRWYKWYKNKALSSSSLSNTILPSACHCCQP